MKNQSQEYYTPIQLKIPVDLEKKIEVDDPVYSFNEVLRHIDLKRYFVEEEDHKTGRPKYDEEKVGKMCKMPPQKDFRKTLTSFYMFRKRYFNRLGLPLFYRSSF